MEYRDRDIFSLFFFFSFSPFSFRVLFHACMKWCPWLIDFHIFVSFPTTTPTHPGSTVFLAYILARFYFQVLIVYIVFVLLFFRLLLLFGGGGGGGGVLLLFF